MQLPSNIVLPLPTSYLQSTPCYSAQGKFSKPSACLKAAQMANPTKGASAGLAININGHNLLPASQMAGGDMFKHSASRSDYILIQFTSLPDLKQEAILRALQVQFCQIIHPNSWVARFEPNDLSRVRKLPFVIYANTYHRNLSLPPGFQSALLDEIKNRIEPPELHQVLVSLHPAARTPEDVRSHLVSNIDIDRDRIFLSLQGLSASLTAEEILQVARLDDVAAVEKEGAVEPHCHTIERVTNLPKARDIARPHLDGESLTGKGEIIVIADSGFDRGIMKASWKDKLAGVDIHPFFTDRVLKLDIRVKTSAKCDDISGHGTHVAGVCVSRSDNIAQQYGVPGPIPNGVAPGAFMIAQKVHDHEPKTKLMIASTSTGDYGQARLLLDPYCGYPTDTPGGVQFRDGRPLLDYSRREAWSAKIHNHSSDKKLADLLKLGHRAGYNAYAAEMDRVIAMVPEIVVVKSAGNDGDKVDTKKRLPCGSGQISSMASAKNVITVGACYNRERDDGITYQDIPLFSSRGPTVCPQGQKGHSKIIKPDVVAPGVSILSARTQALMPAEPRVDDKSSLDKMADFKKLVLVATGTSMSAPVVSGAIALFRQALRRRGFPNPSAALLRALTINGAVDLRMPDPKTKQPAGRLIVTQDGYLPDRSPRPLTEAPDDVQGFGRIDIADSVENIVDTKLSGMVDTRDDPKLPHADPHRAIGLPGDVRRYQVCIPPPPEGTTEAHLKATLAFTDYPGEGLQNQLALSIEFKDQTLARAKNTSVRDPGDARKDRMLNNNVQKLVVRDIQRKQFPADKEKSILADVVVTSLRTCDNPFVKKTPGANLKTPLPFAVVWKVWYT